MGSPRRNIARLNPDGSLDEDFQPTGSAAFLNGVVSATALQADGKIVLGGSLFLNRLNPDGGIDPMFAPPVSGPGDPPGREYRVEASIDLREWKSVGVGMVASKLERYEETNVGMFPRGFYRVVLPSR